MNLDDLMAVWQSQDTAPLHDMDKTLLHLALRQEQAKRQKEERIARWFIYVVSAALVATILLFVAMMIYAGNRKVMTGWDCVIAIGGATAALLAAGAMFVGHRAQTKREERFGDSLRDQLTRRIAQLDDREMVTRAAIASVLLGGIGPIAIILLGYRINEISLSENGLMLCCTIMMCVVWPVMAGVWAIRNQGKEVLAIKHRLEELLKELDSQ